MLNWLSALTDGDRTRLQSWYGVTARWLAGSCSGTTVTLTMRHDPPAAGPRTGKLTPEQRRKFVDQWQKQRRHQREVEHAR